MEKWKTREKKVIKGKNLGIQALPEFVNIFMKSNSVSTSKGKSHFLMRKVKQRAAKGSSEEHKESSKEKSEDVKQLETKLKELQNKISWFEEKEEEAFHNKGQLSKLYELGVIDSDGEYKVGSG